MECFDSRQEAIDELTAQIESGQKAHTAWGDYLRDGVRWHIVLNRTEGAIKVTEENRADFYGS